jgi:hypothetical protein
VFTLTHYAHLIDRSHREAVERAAAYLDRSGPKIQGSVARFGSSSRSSTERPHEALGMTCPAEVYQPSPRIYQGLPDIDYPLHDKVIVVTL